MFLILNGWHRPPQIPSVESTISLNQGLLIWGISMWFGIKNITFSRIWHWIWSMSDPFNVKWFYFHVSILSTNFYVTIFFSGGQSQWFENRSKSTRSRWDLFDSFISKPIVWDSIQIDEISLRSLRFQHFFCPLSLRRLPSDADSDTDEALRRRTLRVLLVFAWGGGSPNPPANTKYLFGRISGWSFVEKMMSVYPALCCSGL